MLIEITTQMSTKNQEKYQSGLLVSHKISILKPRNIGLASPLLHFWSFRQCSLRSYLLRITTPRVKADSLEREITEGTSDAFSLF